MENTYILIFSFVVTMVFFSSGITILGASHRESIQKFGEQNQVYRIVARILLSIMTVTGKIHRAWIRLITPH
jgi:hypothetical protein